MRRVVLGALVLAGCSFRPRAADDAMGPADADRDASLTGDAATDAPLGPWQTPTPVVLPNPDPIDDDPTLTADLLELVFNRGTDLFVTTRAAVGEPWGTAVRVPIAPMADAETTPELSPDGLVLILATNRAGGLGSFDLWMMTRPDRASAWSAPVPLAELNASASEAGGGISADLLEISFTSTRVNGSPDVFTSVRASAAAPWATPVEQAALNTTGHEGSPFLTANRLELYFDSVRGGGAGAGDLYVSRRASITAPWPAPELLDDVNTAADEQDPWVSPDGRHLYFTSNREGRAGLWHATR